MTGFIVSVFPFRNRVSSKEAFEGLELGEGKLSRPVLRGPGGRKAAWLLGSDTLHLKAALHLRSVSGPSIAFHRRMCHRWLCMLLNMRCTVISNPTLSANSHRINSL